VGYVRRVCFWEGLVQEVFLIAIFDIEIDTEQSENDESRGVGGFEEKSECYENDTRIHRMADERVGTGRDKETSFSDIWSGIETTLSHHEQRCETQKDTSEKK